MTKRESAPRRLSRADREVARVLASPTDRIVRDEWSDVSDRLRKLNIEAAKLCHQQAELLLCLGQLRL